MLEAIYLLGRGKSFRHREAGPLLRSGEQSCLLQAKIANASGKLQHLGMVRSAGSAQVRYAGKDIKKRSELLKILPLHLITPRSHALIEGTPEIRRRFMDHGLFHVENNFHLQLTDYYRVLKQRNAALRQRNIKLANSFEPQLCLFGEALNTLRLNYVTKLHLETTKILQDFEAPFKINLNYSQGWDPGSSLEESLALKVKLDLERGYTASGPQRADIRIMANDVAAAKHLSRGQQKLLVYALKLAECRIQISETAVKSIFLIDDIGAELDSNNLGKILSEVGRLGLQTFITAVEPPTFPKDLLINMFHVEHGEVSSL